MKKITARHWSVGGEYTIRCVDCRDTGYVRSFSPKAMRDAVNYVRGKIRVEDIRISYCDVPCHCDEGDERSVETLRMLQKVDKAATAPIRFGDERVIRADPLMRLSDQLGSLTEWAREYQSQLDERAAQREAPYQMFEQFNSGVDFA